MFTRAVLFLGLLLAFPVSPTLGHEYWIEASKFQPAPDENVTANLRVGADLSGEAFPWLAQSFASVSLWSPDGTAQPLSGRMGDLPALKLPSLPRGLHRVTVETTPSFVIFDKAGKFETYLAYEGLNGILERHRARGLPETGFGERYVRNARALVQSGAVIDGQADAPTGMPFELVILGNPYAPGLTDLTVQLLWQGAPAPDVQVALFHVPPGSAPPVGVERLLFTTDSDGRVTFPLRGPGLHLLSAVHIEPVDDSAAAVWQSWWTSLSFAP